MRAEKAFYRACSGSFSPVDDPRASDGERITFRRAGGSGEGSADQRIYGEAEGGDGDYEVSQDRMNRNPWRGAKRRRV